MSNSKLAQRIYRPSDDAIPAGYYRLHLRVTKGDATKRMPNSRIEVDAERRFRLHDANGAWESLDKAEYVKSQLKGPYESMQAMLSPSS